MGGMKGKIGKQSWDLQETGLKSSEKIYRKMEPGKRYIDQRRRRWKHMDRRLQFRKTKEGLKWTQKKVAKGETEGEVFSYKDAEGMREREKDVHITSFIYKAAYHTGRSIYNNKIWEYIQK